MDQQTRAIIVVMGVTGSGKSTFIKCITNDEDIIIGHSVESETAEVQPSYYFDQESDKPVMLLDTPGFDDSHDEVTDADILEKISGYLHQKNLKLNGVLYMHDISQHRLTGMHKKNLQLFQKLCGSGSFINVRIVTTNWSRVSDKEGSGREAELMKGAFKPLIDGGAKMVRYQDTLDSALKILAEVIPKKPVELQVVVELKDGKSLLETSAGTVINEQLIALQKKNEKALEELKKELREAVEANDSKRRAELAEERREREDKLRRMEQDMTKLRETSLKDLQAALERKNEMALEDLKREMQKAVAANDSKHTAELVEERKHVEERVKRLEMDRDRSNKNETELKAELEEERKKVKELRDKLKEINWTNVKGTTEEKRQVRRFLRQYFPDIQDYARRR